MSETENFDLARELHVARSMQARHGRVINPAQPVLVYRNLHRADGPWYSVQQRGLVVAHAREVHLRGVTFVVRFAGYQRFHQTHVKSVHAFVRGFVHAGGAPCWDDGGEELRARYNPAESHWFRVVKPEDGTYHPIESATAARLGPSGLTVWRPVRVATDSRSVNADPQFPEGVRPAHALGHE